jgi:hypothetical protein
MSEENTPAKKGNIFSISWSLFAGVALTVAFYNDIFGIYSRIFPEPKIVAEFHEAEFRLPHDLLANSLANIPENQKLIREIFNPVLLSSGEYESFIFTSMNLKNTSNFAVKNIRVKLPVDALAEIEQENSIPPKLSKANETLKIGEISNAEQKNIYFWSQERISTNSNIDVIFEGGKLSVQDRNYVAPSDPKSLWLQSPIVWILAGLGLLISLLFFSAIVQVRKAAERVRQKNEETQRELDAIQQSIASESQEPIQ